MERKVSNETNEDMDIYVADPELIKEGITSYTSYTLKGKKINEPLVRRYRDFDSLRAKLVERWPGIYLPSIPKKQLVGKTDKEITEIRIELINRFFFKLSNLTDIFNSNEIDFFLQNSSDVSKTLNSLPIQSHEDLVMKYSKVFSDYNENDLNEESSKDSQSRFLMSLKASLPKTNLFRDLVKAMKDRSGFIQETNTKIIDALSLYEKDILVEYVGKKEDKFVFFDMKNLDLSNSIQNMHENISNPYNQLYDLITEDCLEQEAMIEALTGIINLRETLERTKKRFASVSTQLTELQAGKTNIQSIFSFKSKGEDITNLISEKENLEKNIADLDQIIKITMFKMNQDIGKFKVICLKSYYDELSKLQSSYGKNKDIMNELWSVVINDKSIQSLNID